MAEFVLGALGQIWKSLEPQGIPIALMGGIALSAWKRIRATRDIDFLIAVDPPAVDELLSRLCSAGLQPKRHPTVTQIGDIRFIQFSFRPADSSFPLQVDFLLADSDYHRTALKRTVRVQVPGVEGQINVMACEDLILHKLVAGRMIDRADAAELLLANRARLEAQYLVNWSDTLGVSRELAEIWREAFPDEPPPGEHATGA